VTTVEHDQDTDVEPYGSGPPRWLLVALGVVCAIALLGAGAALTVVTGIGTDRPPVVDSVDAGFSRDMSTHHGQAVVMAQLERDNGDDPAVRLVAFDIETGQESQVGQMLGWLESWDQTPQTDIAQMSWMDHTVAPGQLMPGMASTAELAKLKSLSGKPLDIYFLQLMIRHHKGGLEMAQYGAAHASEPYVRALATKIVTAQQNEVVTMEQMLRERGAQPLS
jgi:uncharacterized protein (DUF305 family)